MSDQNPTGPSKLRSRALVGTAVALALGVGIVAEGVLFPPNVALADPVRVEGVAPVSFADIVDKVRPAVVSVRVKSLRSDVSADGDGMPGFDMPPGSPMEKFFKQFRQGPGGMKPKAQPSMALGSGFFISEDGYVVTNNHVIDKEQSVTVITDDGTEYTAKVVGKDEKTDLALLKVDAKDVKFTYVKLADKESRVGDWVVAVGNPFGLGGTVTAGIVSARGREIGAGPYDDFIQIDAPVNRGNSGGPTFNMNGEVIGVNTAIFSPSGGSVGIAFDIPASTVKQVIGDLEAHGTVVRGWLGVQIQPISKEIADSIKLDGTKGALVADPQKDGPALAAGLKAGDAITAVDGNEIKNPRDLAAKIAAYAPGTSVKITYWRDGASHDVEVKLGKLPSDDQLASNQDDGSGSEAQSSLSDFGLALGPSDDNKGVVVTDVDPNGQAAERGLQPGDVILSIGDTAVKAPADIEKKVADAKAGGSKAVLLRVQSGDQTRYVALSFAHT
ncbi:MAG: Do family serine endopeptidase [Rhizobiales bacterium]|nr:Do family serine endopeptidase [Hyphomicrobiales bacterium]